MHSEESQAIYVLVCVVRAGENNGGGVVEEAQAEEELEVVDFLVKPSRRHVKVGLHQKLVTTVVAVRRSLGKRGGSGGAGGYDEKR